MVFLEVILFQKPGHHFCNGALSLTATFFHFSIACRFLRVQ